MWRFSEEYRIASNLKTTIFSAIAAFFLTPVLIALLSSVIWILVTTFYGVFYGTDATLGGGPTVFTSGRVNGASTPFLNIYSGMILGIFSPLFSWAGFIILVPVFRILTKLHLDGLVPCVTAGAAIGPLAIIVFIEATGSIFSKDMIMFACYGAIHSLVFWVIQFKSLMNRSVTT